MALQSEGHIDAVLFIQISATWGHDAHAATMACITLPNIRYDIYIGKAIVTPCI